jgi:hypothetical protein
MIGFGQSVDPIIEPLDSATVTAFSIHRLFSAWQK